MVRVIEGKVGGLISCAKIVENFRLPIPRTGDTYILTVSARSYLQREALCISGQDTHAQLACRLTIHVE